MGVGKSAFGKKLANKLDWSPIDLDTEIENKAGKPISKIFEDDGEQAFRRIEEEALEYVLKTDKAVIAVGGGAPCFLNNAQKMKQAGLAVWLDAPLGMLAQRLANAKQERPLLKGLDQSAIHKRLEALRLTREEHYAKAHMILNTNQLSASEAMAWLTRIIQGRQ